MPREIIPVSEALSHIAGVGLICLRAVHLSQPMSPEERAELLAILKAVGRPMIDISLAVLPGMQALLEAVPDHTTVATSVRLKEMS